MPHRGYFLNPLDYFESPPTDGETKKGPNSDWAFDHKADVAAHHAKYDDAQAKAVHSPMSFPPPAFVPGDSAYDWVINEYYVENKTSLEEQGFRAPVILPHGVTVTKLTLHGFRNDADANMYLELMRINKAEGVSMMCLIIADWISGCSSKYSENIDYATIDNLNYAYLLYLRLDPNDSTADVRLNGATIEFS
ncbi:hypothetical protein ES705_10496 [subsurface metagenome]